MIRVHIYLWNQYHLTLTRTWFSKISKILRFSYLWCFLNITKIYMSNYLFHHIHCKFYIFHYVVFPLEETVFNFSEIAWIPSHPVDVADEHTLVWKKEICKERNHFDKIIANLEKWGKDIRKKLHYIWHMFYVPS